MVPELMVNKHKINPKGIAPIVSSKPFGICVAE